VTAAQAKDPLPPHPATRSDRLIDAGVRNLFGTLGQVPAIILVCGADIYPPGAPAVQPGRPQAGRRSRAP
jgi:hypothetical protein